MNTSESTRSLILAFEQAGQEQVFGYFEELDAVGQAQLLAQAATIDLTEVASLVAEHVTGAAENGVDLNGLQPASYTALPSNGGDSAQWMSPASS